MKHIFIVNSIFSNKDDVAEFCDKLNLICQKAAIDYEIHKTTAQGDAKYIAQQKAQSGEKVRIYACGGDGTVNEVVSGIYGYDNAEIGIIPLGTGNDFIRNFDSKDSFLDIEKVINSGTKRIDLIKWNDNYCINIMNIGFDRAVVARTESLRKNPFVLKSFAYTLGVIIELIKLPMESLKITFDDGQAYDNKFLIALFANGKFYGGGYKAASKAIADDGLIDVMIIQPVSRLRFLSFVSKYKRGTVLDTEFGKRIIIHKRVKSLTIEKSSPFDLCFDGEIKSINKASVEIIPKAIRVAVPGIPHEIKQNEALAAEEKLTITA